ncbi:T9SS type A sorting domain-containing protein [Flavobacterium sp. N1994]|uniref:DUF7619 domain-containing protein n=1 Tax=Flavobacterium sp. N1994 TaxID=2986827 RepID=UPI0022215A1A|nr:T9SS type A sorting domain-containing protein [Flavobacterium sp. N1994]
MKKNYCTLLLIFVFFTSQAQIVNIPDANFKTYLIQFEPTIDTNHDGEIQLSEAQAVTSIYINGNSNTFIQDLTGLEAFTNLTGLYLNFVGETGFNPSVFTHLQSLSLVDMNIATLDLSNLTTLEHINLNHANITSLNITGLINLRTLDCYSNPLTSLNLNGLINLETLNCAYNGLTALNLTGLSSLVTVDCSDNAYMTSLITTGANNITHLNCRGCTLTSLTVTNMTNLQQLDCSYQVYGSAMGISNLDLTGLTSLTSLNCMSNNLTSLNVADLTNLTSLQCASNHITSLDVTPLVNLTSLSCGSNPLTTLNVTPLTHLLGLECSLTSIVAIDLSTLTNLDSLNLVGNAISSLNLSNNSALTELYCSNNQLTALPISNLVNLIHFNCSSNLLTSLDLTNLHALHEIRVGGNLFTSMDFSHNPAVGNQAISINDSPNLTYINVKNGTLGQMSSYGLDISNCPNLQNICTNEEDIAYVAQQIASGSYMGTTPTNLQVNSYCSFVPGGLNNTITGTITLDINHNGCDVNDLHPKDFKININDGTNSGATFTTATGSYLFYVQTGDYALSPQLNNPYFTITPNNNTINITNLDGTAHTQNYCATPNGTHKDLEINLLQIGNARPGFDTQYVLVYKNKGTEPLSGSINLSFDDSVLDFVSANPTISSQSLNNLTWNYTNLDPFESRRINFILNVNSPVETPAVNIDDVLRFVATINPISGDETSEDNLFHFDQTVRGSMDPNDKTCIEGSAITPNMVGGYLNYVIRFQNTGTYYAENVVVKDIIDTSKFDINSLQLVASSHPQTTRISGNKVEFIFENINLPAQIDNEPASHGYVAFKIKTKNNLVLGNAIQNTANIYFDFNAPIITNTTSTTVALLNVSELEINSVSITPIPVIDILEIKALETISSVQLFDIQGRLLQTKICDNTTTTLDFTGKSFGVYLVKVFTSKGMKVQKVIKN